MAGMFGYQAESQAVSRDMAEAALLPAVRAAAPDEVIVADGTSCRHQIRDLAGRQAIHSIRLMERALVASRRRPEVESDATTPGPA
jgi:Fe-S oxidoreductase